MAEIVGSFLGAAIDIVRWVAAPIVRQFNYLCCFTENITSLEHEAEKLDDAEGELQRQVKREIDNVQVIVPAVGSWLENFNAIKNQKETILGEVPNVESGCLKFRARYSLSKKAKKTTDRMKELRGQKIDPIAQPGSPAARKVTPLPKTYEFESRKEIEEEIMTTLRGGDVNVMGIHGMGGLGKTTMAQRIMNRVLEEHVFQEAVMAVVSQQVDKSKIQDEIGGSLGLKLKEETSQAARVQKLHARLTGTKRILLVLDDVWQRLELEDLGIPCNSKACTIFLTSRNSDVLRGMSVQKFFGMKVLSEKDAWFLFRERAGTCVDDSELNSIANEVVKECGGLPIALTVLGALLKDEEDACIWKDALVRLKQSVQDIPDYIAEVHNPLKLSYDFLSPDEAKSVFLLCCLFAEDARIPLERLTYFCVGLGIFKGISNLEEARNRMRSLAKRLKSRSLLLDDIINNEDYVRMHDVVRDVCIFIATQKGCIGGSDCSWFSSFKLLGERNELYAASGFPNLRLLFLIGDRWERRLFKFDDAFLEGVRDLYVLCIENYSLTSLPSQESMKNLKTLILDECEGLETISVVGELVNLEILICRGCDSIEVLPPEIKGLNRLKLLELTGCRKLQSIGRGIISSLVGLEELKMLESFKKWEAEDREERVNAGLRELEALTNLRCLEIEIEDPALATENMRLSSKMERFQIIIGQFNYSLPSGPYYKKLSLKLEGETRLGHWIEMQLLRDSECLYLRGNGAHKVELAKSQKLRWLRLGECETMKNVMRTPYGAIATHQVFPSIQYLEFRSLPQLEEICDGPISSTSFQNLSSIKIRGCRRLRNLGQLSIHAGEDCLSQLQELHIEDCEMMEQVFLWNANNSHITQVFPKLKEIELYRLPNLTTLCQGIQGIEFPLLTRMNLSSIKIRGCRRLRNLGQLSTHAGEDCLSQLQELYIADCEMMEQVFLWNTNNSHITQVFPKLKEIELSNLPNLATLCQGIQGIEFPLLTRMNLSSIKIRGCRRLRNLGQLSTHAGEDCLSQLQELYIADCEMMEQVFLWNTNNSHITQVFPKLKEIELYRLPNLTTLCQGIQGIEFPLLTTISILECPTRTSIVSTDHHLIGSNSNADTDDSSNAYTDDSLHLFCQSHNVSFGNLKEVTIDRFPFTLICSGHKIHTSSFNGLEELRISGYRGSMSLFTSSIARYLVNLRVLRIEDCDEMVQVIKGDDDEENMVSGGKRTAVVFPKLEQLCLMNLPKLVTFCEWKSCDVELPSLRIVRIMKCPDMKNWSLGLLAAPNLEVFITDLNNDLEVVGDNVSFDRLKDLFITENEYPFYHHKIFISLVSGLEELDIGNCLGSMNSFPSSVAANLVSLRKLSIEYCLEMVKVIEDEEEKVVSGGERTLLLFPKLVELRLEYLPKLVRFCEWKCHVELPSLEKVYITGCPNMEHFSLGPLTTPNLKIIKIGGEDFGAENDLNGALQQHWARNKGITRREETESNRGGRGATLILLQFVARRHARWLQKRMQHKGFNLRGFK